MKRQLDFKEKLLRFVKVTKKNTDKHVLIALPILLIVMYISIWVANPSAQVTPTIITEDQEDYIFNGTFVGDIMLGRHVEDVTNRYGQEYLFRDVQDYFLKADYSTGNFESPIVYDEDTSPKDKYIYFKTKDEAVQTLKNLNFTVMNLANNHAMDYMEQGLKDTVDAFEQKNLNIVGIGENVDEASGIIYNEYNDIKVATLGFADALIKTSTATKTTPGVLAAKPELFIPLIAEAKENADLVLVHMHWGLEYDKSISNRQEELGKAISDAGADIIIGHHPHVLQPVDIYNDTVIFYSLGNFIFDQGWSTTRETALAQYKLADNGIATIELTPLMIKEASPLHLKYGKSYFKNKIYSSLKSNSSIEFEEKEGKLTFSVDHSHVVDPNN